MEVEELSAEDIWARKWCERAYRGAVATFLSFQLFDFLFSPIWMHGYLWTLNQPADVDLSSQSSGIIVDRQLASLSNFERFFTTVASVVVVALVLRVSGYSTKPHSVWSLLSLSLACGASAGLLRCQQLQQRLYSVLHESFFVYLNFFVIALCLTIRFDERFLTVQEPLINNKETKKTK